MIPSDPFQPLQLKGEIMDLEFTIDTDHRKRRRNRTTQSCLNCHTSKRKCDRKRPCQRCIQLGLTGLCVDDPTIDESTRLRNRIAELESLVRELRGKPHPRWAESNFRDGDPNEKWHSRATKCIPLKRNANGQAISSTQGGAGGGAGGPNSSPGRGSLLNPVKTEPNPDGSNSHLYRFSSSPAPSMRYHTFQADVRSDSASSFDSSRSGYNNPSGMAYPSGGDSPYANGSSAGGAAGPNSGSGSNYSDSTPNGNSNGVYPGSASDDGTSNGAVNYGGAGGPGAGADLHYNCSCRSNPALGLAYLTLSQTIQTSLGSIRQYSNHPSNSQCAIYRRMVELNTLLQPHSTTGSESPGLVPHTYDSGPPSDSEIMTPLSASGSHASFHTGSPGVSPQEWNHMAAATGFNPYFPAQDHHNVYNVNHVLS